MELVLPIYPPSIPVGNDLVSISDINHIKKIAFFNKISFVRPAPLGGPLFFVGSRYWPIVTTNEKEESEDAVIGLVVSYSLSQDVWHTWNLESLTATTDICFSV